MELWFNWLCNQIYNIFDKKQKIFTDNRLKFILSILFVDFFCAGGRSVILLMVKPGGCLDEEAQHAGGETPQANITSAG